MTPVEKSANYTPNGRRGQSCACDRKSLGHHRRSPYNGAVTSPTHNSYSPTADNLRNLLLIRSIALLGQTGVLAYVLWSKKTNDSLTGVTISLCALALLTMVSLWRTTRPWPVA